MRDTLSVTIRLNGELRQVSVETTVTDLLASLGRPAMGIAVEINREVVPRSRHAETRLREGDSVEIVHMVGGG